MFQETGVLKRRGLYNDSEFKEVVRIFHQLVTQINKSYKKQRRKKSQSMAKTKAQVVEVQPKKKEEFKHFNRNSFHVQIAYKLYFTKNNSFQNMDMNLIDKFDPTLQSKRMRKNNGTDFEYHNHNNHNQITLIEQSDNTKT